MAYYKIQKILLILRVGITNLQARPLVSVLVSFAITACGGVNGVDSNNNSLVPKVPPAASVSWSGTVNAVGHPLSGAQVTIYGAASSRASTPVTLAQTTTDNNGQFKVSSVPALPATGQLVYVVANGSNTATRLMSVMGAYCAAANSCSFATNITINELTTTAASFSLAAYLTDGTTVAIAGNAVGVTNAANTFNSLVNTTTGNLATSLTGLNCQASVTNQTNCLLVQKLNTLANLMASCSAAASATDTTCVHWLAIGNQASNTLGLSLQIATQAVLRNNGIGIFNAVIPPAIYSPTLAAAPTDWNMALSIIGGGLNGPAALAIDALGHVWVCDSLQSGALSEFAADGTPLSPANGFSGNGLNGPQGLAIDLEGHVWVANWAQGSGSTLSIFNSDGSTSTGSPITKVLQNGLTSILGPIDLALASNGNMWVANYGNSTLSQFSSNGTLTVGPVIGAGLSFPTSVATDNAGNVWLVNSSNSNVSEFNVSGSPIHPTAYTNIGLNNPSDLALTSSGDLWISNQVGNSLIRLIGGNTPPATCPQVVATGNTACVATTINTQNFGFHGPTRLAIDGAGNVWVANRLSATLTEISSNGTLLSNTAGYQSPDISQPSAIAVDASGNVWVANMGSNTLTKFIGIAAPVALPKQGQPVPL